jgi:radical SAM superfamily enzyme YgiQ (UPF0313 family)
MISVQLIHPPHPNSTEDRLDPHLGLLLIASYLRDFLGVGEVTVNDLSGIDEEDWKVDEADIYGLTVYATTLALTDKIARVCKEKNRNSIVVVGGAHPSCLPASPEFMSNPDIDLVVIGEGEIPMANIVRRRLRNASVPSIDGKIIPAASEPFDYFLFPSFDLIDVTSYHRTVGGERSLPFLTTRGCPFSCSFCGLSKMHELGRRVRFCPPKMAYEHILRIKTEFGINAINFQDDQFTLNRPRLFEMLDMIKDLGIKFRCHGRAGYDNEEVYKKLSEAGCVQVAWGIESGSQEILNRMNKRVKVQDNYNVIEWAKKYGITSRAFIIIGFPGETRETLEETKEFIKRADPDQVFVSSMVCYPGTDVWNNPVKYGITNLDTDFSQYYQVGRDGLGGLSFDTEWLSKQEFRELEIKFRTWIQENVRFRGSLLDYEKVLYDKKGD